MAVSELEFWKKQVEKLKKELAEEKDKTAWLEDNAGRWMKRCLAESDKNKELQKLVDRYKGEVEELGELLDQYE
jgi:hypothetical protein